MEMAEAAQADARIEQMDKRRRRVIRDIPRYEEGENLDTYLFKCEKILTKECIPEDQWLDALERLVPGRLASYLTQGIPESVQEDYYSAKEALLMHEGYGMKYYIENLYYAHTFKESYAKKRERVSTAWDFIMANCTNMAEQKETFVKYFLVSCFRPDCYNVLLNGGPVDASDRRRLMTAHMSQEPGPPCLTLPSDLREEQDAGLMTEATGAAKEHPLSAEIPKGHYTVQRASARTQISQMDK